jgi:hypothetical protein
LRGGGIILRKAGHYFKREKSEFSTGEKSPISAKIKKSYVLSVVCLGFPGFDPGTRVKPWK